MYLAVLTSLPPTHSEFFLSIRLELDGVALRKYLTADLILTLSFEHIARLAVRQGWA